MLARLLRRWSSDLLRPLVRILMRVRATPNRVTLAGLALCAAAGLLIGIGRIMAAGIVLLIAGLVDALDGELARESGTAAPFGGFVDSIADHYGDFAVYLGLAWWSLQMDDAVAVLLTLFAMFGSLAGSQIRSRAGMLGLDTKDVGLFTRAERVIVLTAGFVTGLIMPALAILAVANNVSALQRLTYVVTHAARRDAPRG